MSAGARIGAFVATLAAVFALAFALGRELDPREGPIAPPAGRVQDGRGH